MTTQAGEPGKLADLLGGHDQAMTITELTVDGTLNADDVRELRLMAWRRLAFHGGHVLIHKWHRAPTLNCKILLPKFNTWEQVHSERKKGSLPPFYNTIGRFLAKSLCRYGAIALPLHCNRNAIVP